MGLINRVKKIARRARIMKKVKHIRDPTVLREGANLRAISKTHLLTGRIYAGRMEYYERVLKNADSTRQEKAKAIKQIKVMRDMVQGNKEWATAARFEHVKRAKAKP
jgi:hypothetical protein